MIFEYAVFKFSFKKSNVRTYLKLNNIKLPPDKNALKFMKNITKGTMKN